MARYQMRYDVNSIQPEIDFLQNEIATGNAQGLIVVKCGKMRDIAGIYTLDTSGRTVISPIQAAWVIANSMARQYTDFSETVDVVPRPGAKMPNEFECVFENEE